MQDWQDFLSTQTLSDEPIGECSLCDLSHLGLIRVQGEDARTLLQGQLSNDIDKVSATLSQLSSYCSPKGRMLASFRILEREDKLLLMLPAERLQPILKRLQMFVLMSKVELSDASNDLARIEISGDCAADLLPIDPPTEVNGSVTADGYSIVRIAGDRPRYLVLGPQDAIQSLWMETAQTATPFSHNACGLSDIRAGIPTIVDATAEAFVPQMANLHAIKGVSFTKGCYTGQEIVARMQYLGKLKRRMYRVRIDAPSQPQAGDELFSEHSASGQGAGKVVSAAPSPEGGYEALVVIEISAAEAGDIHLGELSGPRLEFLNLPYEVN